MVILVWSRDTSRVQRRDTPGLSREKKKPTSWLFMQVHERSGMGKGIVGGWGGGCKYKGPRGLTTSILVSFLLSLDNSVAFVHSLLLLSSLLVCVIFLFFSIGPSPSFLDLAIVLS